MKLISVILLTFLLTIKFNSSSNKTVITWVDRLTGDFSFSKHKSITCDAWCYEWAGTNIITATHKENDTIICETMMNEATHCSLHLIITKDSCIPTINLLSITPNGNKTYSYKSGYIKIDRRLWEENIIKADFSFDFINDENEKRIYWQGKIYTKIK